MVGFEPSLDAIVDKAIDAGIPVVTLDADLPGSKELPLLERAIIKQVLKEAKS